MADSLTKEQKKRKAIKEAQKKKKAESKGQENSESKVEERIPDERNRIDNKTDDDVDDDFESELCWCVEQLQLGLKNKKPNKDEAQKAQKLIKTLRSEKASKVRKRQIMHNTFGNYRKKMADDLKRSNAFSKEPNFVALSEDKLKRSVYIKTKHDRASETYGHELSENSLAAGAVSEEEKWRFQASDNSFKFSFSDPPS